MPVKITLRKGQKINFSLRPHIPENILLNVSKATPIDKIKLYRIKGRILELFKASFGIKFIILIVNRKKSICIE